MTWKVAWVIASISPSCAWLLTNMTRSQTFSPKIVQLGFYIILYIFYRTLLKYLKLNSLMTYFRALVTTGQYFYTTQPTRDVLDAALYVVSNCSATVTLLFYQFSTRRAFFFHVTIVTNWQVKK